MIVLLTGARGNLGTQLAAVFSRAGHEVIATERGELDITDNDAVQRFVAETKPDCIINAAAYNFVDKVEDPAVYPLAYAVNALGPKHLAEAAAKAGILFVHYSTDYVLAGDKPEGYTEDDPTGAPCSKYGETKAAGERFVRESGATYFICRLSKIFGPAGMSDVSKPSFVSLMELRIVHEEVGMPTYTKDVAETTLWMVEHDVAPGVYHVVNEGKPVTMFEYAEEVFALTGTTTPRVPVPSSAFPRPAKAPKFAALVNTKLPKLRSRSDALADSIASGL
ncbi:sugar nucleotide-binding protein [Candidatus Uhrbacteria bacterium]|nr:sugar nucleotide-binding protein [Candidatus Uhrbacteria bacterium]